MREEREVDLVQHLRREPMVADADHDAEMVSAGPKRAPQSRIERLHARQCRREGKRAKRAAWEEGTRIRQRRRILGGFAFAFPADSVGDFGEKRVRQAMRGTFYSSAFPLV